MKTLSLGFYFPDESHDAADVGMMLHKKNGHLKMWENFSGTLAGVYNFLVALNEELRNLLITNF